MAATKRNVYIPPADIVRPTELEELKEFLIAQIKARQVEHERAGYAHDFGEPYGVQVLQVRNNTDKTNWLTSQAAYLAQMLAGNGDVMGATFRTAANETITMSFAGAHQVIMQMAYWGAQIAQTSWALQDAVRSAHAKPYLDTFDIDEDWPL